MAELTAVDAVERHLAANLPATMRLPKVGFRPMAEGIVAAITRTGLTIEPPLPYDREGDGHMFESMCSACLNEPIDVEDIDGPCPEREGANL